MVDVPIYGRVATMELFKPPLESKHLLFISTERHMFCVLAYDAVKGELVTRAMGDLTDRIGRPTERGQIGIVDPECRVIGLHLYDGLFKVIPMDQKGQLREAFNIRLEELVVLDIKFLHGCAKPTVAVLYEDTKEGRHVKTYEVNVKDKDFAEGPWAQNDVEGGSSLIVPVPAPLGGAIVIGEAVIVYLNKKDGGDGGDGAAGGSSGVVARAVATRTANVMAHGVVDADGSRHLLSDASGALHLLVLVHDRKRVHALKLEPLGNTSIASSLSYLDNGVVYVGSAYGDCQLVRLHATPLPAEEGGGFVEVLESFTNLGPIVDFSVVDLDRHGQGQVVTCSGVQRDGSLRVVRNGVGIHEQAAIELPGVKGCWSLRPSDDAAADKYLVVTFLGETRILAMNDDDELEETEFEGFDGDAETLCACNVDGGYIAQATSRGVALVDAATGERRARWTPPEGASVTVAAGNRTQILVAVSGGTLVSLAAGAAGDAMDTGAEDHLLREVASRELGEEIACLDCTPLSDPGDASAKMCAAGLWSMEAKTLSMPDLRELSTAPLAQGEGAAIPRAVLLCAFEGTPYLLAGLGDGQLYAHALADEITGGIDEVKKLSLGTQPITLRTFRNKNTAHVFAGSDRPTVIHSNNGKLVYSNVNLREVTSVCPFSCDAFPDSLALVSETDLTIGSIDDIQKLHIRTVPLGEQPRRIAHQASTRTFAALTQAEHPTTGESSFHVRLFDDQTFETTHKFDLQRDENDSSIISCSFADDPREYYVVGTAFTLPEEVEPTRGRILVLVVRDGRLSLVAEKEVKGAVYNLNAFNGKLLAGINSKVQLFKWTERGGGGDGGDAGGGANHELVNECSHHGHIVALYVETRGDFIVVGDLMKSISLLVYKPDEGAIEERARDFNSKWMTAVDILDDDTYLGAENSFNLFTVRKNTDAATDEERSRLEVTGEYHLGEFVNRFRRGSLVMRMPDGDHADVPTLLFGTVNGVIGVLASLPPEQFAFLLELQRAMRKVVSGVGGFSHERWRSFHSEHRGQATESRGFVDGDLVESFLDLRREKAEEVAATVKVSVEELTKRVEELARLTH